MNCYHKEILEICKNILYIGFTSIMKQIVRVLFTVRKMYKAL